MCRRGFDNIMSQLTSSSFGRNVKLGVPCLDAACKVGLNQLSVARNPDKPTQNKWKQTNRSHPFDSHNFVRFYPCVEEALTTLCPGLSQGIEVGISSSCCIAS